MKNGIPIATQVLAEARRAGQEVAAFNFTEVWDLTAIVNAARRRKVPIIASSFWAVAVVPNKSGERLHEYIP